jgi:hypothetical protein
LRFKVSVAPVTNSPAMPLCVKCKKEEESCIDIKFAIYCSPCFLEATYHKYRILLARSRENIHGTRGLILLPKNFLDCPQVYRASRVLIHFSQLPSIQEPARKNLVTYNLGIPVSGDYEKVKKFIEGISAEYPLLGDIYALSIDSNEIKKFDDEFAIVESSNNLNQLSNTLKEDLLNAKLLHLQLKLMNQIQVDRAVTPETSTALASHILTCTCKGRGKFLPWDSALIRSFPGNLFLSRPLKEISDREIELYCQETKFLNLSSSDQQIKTQAISSFSIDKLTVNFLTNLESENPGTANVVIRTSSKVRTTMTELSQVDEFSVRCKICLAPNDVQICSSCSPIKEFF